MRRIWDWMIGAVVVLAIAWVTLFYVFAPELPDTDALWDGAHSPRLTVIAADGSRLAQKGGIGGVPIRLSKLPAHLPQAVIATEDRRFYEHFGMDVVGFARAVIANLRAGAMIQGGSTITQQLAKNLYLEPERTLLRKIQELYLAIWLETRLSKDEILELYLNRVYLGAGAYGVEAAAQRYFSKSARQVSLTEAAMLAGLLKAPSRYAPTNDLALARARADQVLQNMVAAGYLSPAQAATAQRHPAALAKRSATGSSNYFVDWITERLQDHVHYADKDLTVFTTLEPAMQAAAESILERALARNGKSLHVRQAALVAIDGSGAVRAMVGGRAYKNSQFNRVVQARRQPGSAFKPFVYLAALEAGLTPDSRIEDKPVAIGDWRPRNYSGRYRGQVTLREGLADSINSVAVRLQERISRDRVIATARRLGIDSDLSPHPSLALGTAEVTLLELTAAYAPFANGGRAVRPYGIATIREQSGRRLYGSLHTASERVIEPRHLAQMNDMLAEVLRSGTGRNARPRLGSAAGKTGTTQDFRDGWFIGYSGDLVIGVWVGNDDNRPTKGVTGGGLPARMWKQMADWAQSTRMAARGLPLPRRKPEPGPAEGIADRVIAWIFDQVRRHQSETDERRIDAVEETVKEVYDWFSDQAERDSPTGIDPEARRGR